MSWARTSTNGFELDGRRANLLRARGRRLDPLEFTVVIRRRHRLASAVDRGNKSTLNLATRVESFAVQATAPAILQALSEQMMGLEPTTFCMASAGGRSCRFA